MEVIRTAIAKFKGQYIVDRNGRPKFRAPPVECVSYEEDPSTHHAVLYDLTWDNLQVLGEQTIDILRDLYQIRLQIYAWLLLLAKAYECELEMVGTDSINSDMDINVTGNNRITFVSEAYSTLNDAIKPIGKNIEEVFDMNMYASSFAGKDISLDVLHSNQYQRLQRVWAYVHLYEAIQLGLESLDGKNEDSLKADLNNLKTKLQQYPLYIEAKNKWEGLVERISSQLQFGGQADFNQMTKTLRHCDLLHTNVSSSKEKTMLNIVECLSTVQFYSRETYYTRGAYMHVVEKHTNLTKEEYIDSIIDNLAFVVEQHVTHHGMSCESNRNKDAREKYLRKLGKYLYRIFHAFLLIFQQQAYRPLHRELPSRVPSRRMTTSSLMTQASLPKRPLARYDTDPNTILQGLKSVDAFMEIYNALQQAENARKSGDASKSIFENVGVVIQKIGASTSSGSPTIIQSIFEIVFEGISLADSKVLAQA